MHIHGGRKKHIAQNAEIVWYSMYSMHILYTCAVCTDLTA